MCFSFVVAPLFCLGQLATTTESHAKKPIPVHVSCAALALENPPRLMAPIGENRQQPQLVVIGKVLSVDGTEVLEIAVEKVLGGSHEGKTIRVSRHFAHLPRVGERWIFSLVPAIYAREEAFILRYVNPVEEEAAFRALFQARVDTNSLAAEAVFVGKEVEVIEAHYRIVEVLRPLTAKAPAKGERITIYWGGFTRWMGEKPLVRKQPEVYFVGGIETKSERHWPEEVKAPLYNVAWRQPAEQEKTVLDALKQADRLPLKKGTVEGEPILIREVLFRGTRPEAFALLGSANEGAISLAERKLISEGKGSRVDVLRMIEERLFRQTEETPGDHRRLHRLIGVLADIDEERKEGTKEIERLLDQFCEHIRKEPPAPPLPKGRDRWQEYQNSEEMHEDVNHALAWLVGRLNDETVHSRVGPKLLKLRDSLKGGWRGEVQLALDVTRVEDTVELKAGLEAMRGINPVRSASFMQHPDSFYVVTFSNDGRFLATVGGEARIWRTDDWSLVSAFEISGSVYQARFSPGDKWLYVAGGATEPTLARFDWRTGKLDKSYTSHKHGPCELDLSSDGRIMASADYYDEVFKITDTESGKVLHTFRSEDLQHFLTLRPDGKVLLRAKADAKTKRLFEGGVPEWTFEVLDGPTPKVKLPNKRSWLFSPAGAHVVSTDLVASEKPDECVVLVAVHDSENLRVLADRKETAFGTYAVPSLAVSADGKRLAVVSLRKVSILALPSLKTVSTFEVPARDNGLPEGRFRGIALSPDGGTFAAAAAFHATPFLYDTRSGKRILPTPAHTDRIGSFHFSADDKQIRTIGHDNHVCHWDAQTMTLKNRVAFPPTLEVLSTREPDGRFLVCQGAGTEKEVTFHTVDTDTGKLLSSFQIPRWGTFDRPSLTWLDDEQAMIWTRERQWRFNYRTGRIIKETKVVSDETEVKDEAFLPKGAIVTLKGISFVGKFWLSGWEPDTGQTYTLPEIRLPKVGGRHHGLVPGGKYLYFSDPGFYLLDRKTFEIVARREFRELDVMSTTFSPNGKYFAAVTGGRWDSDRQTVIRICDTATCKTLGAFLPATYSASVRFSPDGNFLAVHNAGDQFEIWDLETILK